MEKNIQIDGREIPFKATAATIRIYRQTSGRDLLMDMATLRDASKKKDHVLTAEELEMFENMAFVMAKQADPENTPATADEWLDQFSIFSIWQVLPQIVELWQMNEVSTSEIKKK